MVKISFYDWVAQLASNRARQLGATPHYYLNSSFQTCSFTPLYKRLMLALLGLKTALPI